ncbi:zinc knuckle-domain-containing protein [Annulohypoxylon bovei var. microspora]|nr:zinc knuckle-domain-containing protein [Annulohypoxylon bovei var. microspora]
MYRRGPPKSTPASVQCQKCLKRGHYSYECKASSQDRPYVPRPSRTQQLFNPKLVPKLASDEPSTLPQKQKGVADEELAKREAERAKKRELEDDGSENESPKRRRSASYDSVSSISTRRSASPPPRAQQSSAAPPDNSKRGNMSPSPVRHVPRRQSHSPASDYERRYSPTAQRPIRSGSPLDRPSRRSRSSTRDSSPTRSRCDERDEAPKQRQPDSRRRRYSSSPSRSPPTGDRRRFRSRSPDEPRRRGRTPPRQLDEHTGLNSARSYTSARRRGGAPPRREQRERSLSPFSKRLALTQAMNTSR